jgi:3-methyladenine DNA glycosylase AlkC
MYEFLTGVRAFPSDNKREVIMDRQRMDKLPKSKLPRPMREIIPQIPAMLEEIIRKCMQANADDRYAKTEELLLSLRELKDTFIKEETDIMVDGKFTRAIAYKGHKIKLSHLKWPLLLSIFFVAFGAFKVFLKWLQWL